MATLNLVAPVRPNRFAQATRIQLFDVRRENVALRRELSAAIADVVSGGSFIGGPQVDSFEREFAAFCSCRHCVGVGSGSDALFLALRALGIGRGDEVITTAYSFVATAQAITRTGATPKFADIDPDTCNIDPARISEQITTRTRAIVPVHLFGHPADMDPINRLARQHHLSVVEDAAQAHGASHRGRVVGSLGDIACFSFYPTKNLAACGDGGAIVTNNADIARTVRNSANHAAIGPGDFQREGWNSRLDAIQAAILRVKLARLETRSRRRREIARLYEHHLSGLDLRLPRESPATSSVFHVYAVRVASGLRAELHEHLAERGIESRVYYPLPLPFLSGFRGAHTAAHLYPEAVRASRELLALPCHPGLTDAMVETVAYRTRQFLKERGRATQGIA